MGPGAAGSQAEHPPRCSHDLSSGSCSLKVPPDTREEEGNGTHSNTQ